MCLTILLVQLLDLHVESTLAIVIRIVSLIQLCNSSELWAGDLCQRVECHSVKSYTEEVDDKGSERRQYQGQCVQPSQDSHSSTVNLRWLGSHDNGDGNRK